MLYTLFIILITITILRSIITNFWLFFILKWLNINYKKIISESEKNNANHKFILLIPVLKEQKIINTTIDYFSKLNYKQESFKIFFISTEKEFEDQKVDEKNTIEIIKNNTLYGSDLIKLLHYPDKKGKMVDQLNFAFDYILKNETDLDKTFIGIYNADSRPNIETLNTVSMLATKNNGRVYQQSAVFFDNFNQFKNGNNFWTEKFLKNNALLQVRWTLVHEIPRLLRQSFCTNKFNKRFFLSHCIGHGLFIRSDFLKEIKKMPYHTLTEDLFFGYILSLLREPINPIPIMESAEMPNSFSMALKQKYVWFFGPFDHFTYKKYFKSHFKNKANNFLLNWFTLQGIFPAFAWLLSGWIFLYIFIYPILSVNYNLLLWSILAFGFYAPFAYFIILCKYEFLNNLCSKQDKISTQEYLWSLIFSLPTSIIHSVPPIFSIFAKLKSKITKFEPQKPKTER